MVEPYGPTNLLAERHARPCGAATVTGPGHPTSGEGHNPRLERVIEQEFIVDSGAIYALCRRPCCGGWVSAVARRLRWPTAVISLYRLRHLRNRRPAGASKVIFGAPGDASLLGAVTLEELGLMLDPLRRELRPLPMQLV